MNQRRTGTVRLLLAAGTVCAAVAVLGVALALAVWAGSGPTERAALERVAAQQGAVLVAGGVLLLGLVALAVVRLFGRYVRGPRRLAADTRLIAAVNPGHRVEAAGPAELADLAGAINELAARYDDAKRDVDAQVATGRADLEQERNRLAALMSELTAAVLVCNAEGQILLYNAAAQRLLAGAAGLGRSVFGVVDRNLIAHAHDRIRAGAQTYAATTPWGDRILRVHVAQVSGGAGGFVLHAEDITRRADAAGRRDELLRTLTEGTRASLGATRVAVENLIEYADMPPDQRDRFVRIIRDETVALGGRLDALMQRSAADLTDRSLRDDMAAEDLLAALEAGMGLRVSAAAAATDLWLSVDSYAVVRAVAVLAARLRADHGVAEVRLDLNRSDRYAALSIGWDGDPVDAATLREWTADPIRGAGTEPVAAVLARHDAQAWSRSDAAGTAYLRLLLPLSAAAPSRAGPASPRAGPAPSPAGVEAAAGDRAPAAPGIASRPEFYDFDLFRSVPAGAEAGWEDRPLDELTYTVFDTETTGFLPDEGDEIIAIGAVRVLNGRLLRQEIVDLLVDPQRSVPERGRRVHGITPQMLAGQPTLAQALPRFAQFADGTVLVGHNVAFDLAFLSRARDRTGVDLAQPALDTLLLSAVAHPDHEEHTLEAIARRLGVSVIGRHSALGDALLTGEIFIKLVRLLRDRGVVTLGQAREASRRTYHARLDRKIYG